MTENPPQDRRWRALYAYCHRGKAATDRLIVDVVAPTARALRAEGHIDAWFFIRYWEGGPHLRIRLAGHDPQRLEQAVKTMRAALEPALAAPTDLPTLAPEDFYRQFSITEADAAALEWHPDGHVVETDYEPEVDRYGGAEGIGLAEDLFCVSSELAALVIARAEADQARTGIALDLLLGFVPAMYDTTGEGIRWLREYATMWRYLDQVVAERFARMRAAAESTLSTAGTNLIPRRDALGDKAPAAYRRWWGAVADTTRRLRELAESGALTTEPDVVMVSQLHMLCNRLGLTASDEVYLAWLASLVLAAPTTAPDYFADAVTAPDRTYHELSKFRPATMTAQQPRSAGSITRSLEFASDDPIPLPPIDPATAATPLADTIAARRSARDGLTGRIDLARLATLLGLGTGIVGAEPYPPDAPTVERPVHANPSAGMAYPLIVRVMAAAVDGLRPALYEYLPRTHALQQVGGASPSDALLYSSPFFTGDPPRIDVSEAPAVLFVGADLGQLRTRYGLRAHRFAMLEIGHAAQSLLLVSTALGLRSVPVGGFYDDAVCELAQLDGYDEILGYLIPIGSPSDDGAATTNSGDLT